MGVVEGVEDLGVEQADRVGHHLVGRPTSDLLMQLSCEVYDSVVKDCRLKHLCKQFGRHR